MTALNTARITLGNTGDAAQSIALPAAWWLLPSVLGGAYVWYSIISAVFELIA